MFTDSIWIAIASCTVVGSVAYIVGFMDGHRVTLKAVDKEAANLRTRLFTGSEL